jgi:3-methyladenine DNA glycosylase/8-oxoguanine DNA glycosylase
MKEIALSHLQTDATMAEVIGHFGPLKQPTPRRLSPFRSIVHAIIHQQLSGKAAGTILRRFQGLSRNGGFPTPALVAGLDPQKLREVGLSRGKVRYVQALARKMEDGKVPSLKEFDRMTDDEIVRVLTEIDGVGQWTAEMFLIFNLGRPDVLPVDDLGVRRGYQIAYRKRSLPNADKLRSHGQRWSPFRTTAALYLWKAADFLKDGEW